MKGDGGCVSVVNNDKLNRDLLARRIQRQYRAVSVAEDGFQVNPVLRAARIGAAAAEQLLWYREQDNLQKSIEKQEKSERLLGKENTNG